MNKNNKFSKVVLFNSIFLILLLVATIMGFTALRNSEAEISNLQVSERVDKALKPINPNVTISSKADNIYISGRLAHVQKTKVKIEFINTVTNTNQNGYPKTIDIKVGNFPNNYFAIRLDQNSCKSCTGFGWLIGKYKVKIYPINDKNPLKPEVDFGIIK